MYEINFWFLETQLFLFPQHLTCLSFPKVMIFLLSTDKKMARFKFLNELT
jgi:hypothetical protein